MGLFDNTKSGGSAGVADRPDMQQLESLRTKYQSVLTLIEREGVRLHNLHVQDGKLLIRGEAPTDAAKNRVWDQIKLVDPTHRDLLADLTVNASTSSQAAPHTTGSGTGRTYTVKAGDTLSGISRDFYGDANEYMRIFHANRDKLSDPDKIQPGQQLVIP